MQPHTTLAHDKLKRHPHTKPPTETAFDTLTQRSHTSIAYDNSIRKPHIRQPHTTAYDTSCTHDCMRAHNVTPLDTRTQSQTQQSHSSQAQSQMHTTVAHT